MAGLPVQSTYRGPYHGEPACIRMHKAQCFAQQGGSIYPYPYSYPDLIQLPSYHHAMAGNKKLQYPTGDWTDWQMPAHEPVHTQKGIYTPSRQHGDPQSAIRKRNLLSHATVDTASLRHSKYSLMPLGQLISPELSPVSLSEAFPPSPASLDCSAIDTLPPLQQCPSPESWHSSASERSEPLQSPQTGIRTPVGQPDLTIYYQTHDETTQKTHPQAYNADLSFTYGDEEARFGYREGETAMSRSATFPTGATNPVSIRRKPGSLRRLLSMKTAKTSSEDGVEITDDFDAGVPPEVPLHRIFSRRKSTAATQADSLTATSSHKRSKSLGNDVMPVEIYTRKCSFYSNPSETAWVRSRKRSASASASQVDQGLTRRNTEPSKPTRSRAQDEQFMLSGYNAGGTLRVVNSDSDSDSDYVPGDVSTLVYAIADGVSELDIKGPQQTASLDAVPVLCPRKSSLLDRSTVKYFVPSKALLAEEEECQTRGDFEFLY